MSDTTGAVRRRLVIGAAAAVIAAGACVALGFVYLNARRTLHDFYQTRHLSGTMHLHYALMRRLAFAAVAGGIGAGVTACLTLRRWRLLAAVGLLAVTLALTAFGLQQSPADFYGSIPGPRVSYAVGKDAIYPEPERREFHLAALLAFVAAAAASMAAYTVTRGPAPGGSPAAPDPHAHTG